MYFWHNHKKTYIREVLLLVEALLQALSILVEA